MEKKVSKTLKEMTVGRALVGIFCTDPGADPADCIWRRCNHWCVGSSVCYDRILLLHGV